jgi:glycine cleavage system aminomethyltransferase T
MVPLPLHDRHASLGASFGELKGREVVASVPGQDEDRALRTGAGLFDASAREVVRISGPDRGRRWARWRMRRCSLPRERWSPMRGL